MNMKPLLRLFVFLFLILFQICSCREQGSYSSWEVYGGNKENNHYSSLNQIDTSNVEELQVAWTFHTMDADSMTQIQVNPIIIDSFLYGVSPKLKLFALDAFTGKQKWIFNPLKDASGKSMEGSFGMNVCRGVTYYTDKKSGRIFYSADGKLYCIDALSGMPVLSFGDSGKIDLHNDLGREVSKLYVAATSPGIIYKDMIIIGTRVSEEAAAAPGHIRAYDVHSGKLRWIFHTIPQPGEFGYDSWENKDAWKHIGGANAWAGFSLDEKNGILFAPTGSASYDFYGGKRKGNNLFANCILALDAQTGKRIWHFQTVHHDVWDRDLPSAPVLISIKKDGKNIDVIAQITKSGFIFLLDRKTGNPVYPIEERSVPSESELVGEKLSPVQPVPTFPKPFARQAPISESDLNNLVSDSSFADIKNRLSVYKTGSIFTPPSKQGTIIFPGFDGGGEWGGAAFDPETSVVYVNNSEMPWILTMVDTKQKSAPKETNFQAGLRLFRANCMACHGTERQGSGNNPSLIGVQKKYDLQQFASLLASGRRMMPAFKQLSQPEIQALASFILEDKKLKPQLFAGKENKEDSWTQLPYNSTGYNKFLTKEGYPAIKPPWGSLTAINLNTGEFIWRDTLGDYPDLKAKGIHSGTEQYGGSVVTAGGLLFIAATSDAKIRAFNKRTGKLLWESGLPASGFATPSVYEVNGKQFVVIACGGGKLGKPSGDAYVAFALPENVKQQTNK